MKPNFLLCSLAGLLLAGQASAIQDSNANALSDVWERYYNGNALLSASNPAHAATADPDGDGWSNEKEAIAGTNPFSPVLPAGLVQNKIVSHPEVPAMFLVSWNSLEGKSYKLRVSDNLVTWADFGEVIPGTGSNIELAVEASDDEGGFPGKLFWRVVIEDRDPDGDTLNSWEEVTLGYNPNHQDTDLDGLPDNTDPLPLASATLADPDGLNLPAGLETGLIGRWDFESQQMSIPPPTGYQLYRYDDLTPNNRPARSFGTELDTLGMVSKAASHNGNTFSTISRDLLTGKSTYSVSFWAVVKPGTITTVPTGLFSHHRNEPFVGASGSPNWAFYKVDLNGLWVQKEGTQIYLYAGSYNYINYVNSTPPVLMNPPSTSTRGLKIPIAADKIDDGGWHHYVMTRAGNKVVFYLDGVKLGEISHTPSTITDDAYATISVGRLFGISPDKIPSQPATRPTSLNGKIDRLRVWSRELGLPDAQSIFRQDIDKDQLWDITENRSSTWRDTNSNGEREAEEFSYDPNPLRWSPTNGDTDRDGLGDLQEQTLGTDIARADTDGDLMPDGWEVANGLNPMLASDAALDNDTGGGDGLTNLDEYRFNSDPKKRDSDGDGKLDGPEAKGPDGNLNTNDGSNPSDPRDGGNPIPPAERVQILLGIGDKSGSHSEDYEMIVYRINPDTGSEERYYTLRSGGFGQYEEETVNFWKGDTLTFQMQWNGTNNGTKSVTPSSPSTEGPDYDYSFKVQPQGTTHGAVLVDSWKKADGSIDTDHPLLNDDANDVATTQSEFRENYVDKRVALISLKPEWVVVDGYENLDAHIDPWTGVEKGKRIFPEYKNPADNKIRHSVKLVVKGGLKGVPVYVKSFDVDDSTSEAFDKNFDLPVAVAVIDTNGAAGDDNLSDFLNTAKSGHFWDKTQWGDNEADNEFDDAGRAEFSFRVGMQPGNNYRVAVRALSPDGLSSLQVENKSLPAYIGPELQESGGVTVTEPLTVWRRLWVENDSMAAIPLDAFGYKRNDLSNDLPNPRIVNPPELTGGGNFTQFVFEELKDESSFLVLEHGKLLIDSNYYAVTNTGEVGSKHFAAVGGDLTSIPVNSEFRLYDDDGFGLNHEPLPRLDLVNSAMVNAYKVAFIQPTDASAHNPRKIIDFYRNHPAWVLDGGILNGPGIWDDKIDLSDSRNLWAALLVAGYQEDVTGDKDPISDDLTEGSTVVTRHVSIIFVETIRDNRDSPLRNQPLKNSQYNTEIIRNYSLTAAHEMGHMPGHGTEASHHAEGGLMDANGYDTNPEFSAKTVLRFRGTTKWQNP